MIFLILFLIIKINISLDLSAYVTLYDSYLRTTSQKKIFQIFFKFSWFCIFFNCDLKYGCFNNIK